MNPVALGLGLCLVAPDDPIVADPSSLFEREEQALQQQSLQQKLEQTLQQQEQQQQQLPQQHFMPFVDSGQGDIMTSVSSGAASPPAVDQHHQVSGTVSLGGGIKALPLQLEAQAAVNSYLAMMLEQQNTGGPFSTEVPDMQRQLVPSPQQSMDLLAQPRFFQQGDAGNLQIQHQQPQQLDQQQKDGSRSGPKDGTEKSIW
jgi:hypothetical protein